MQNKNTRLGRSMVHPKHHQPKDWWKEIITQSTVLKERCESLGKWCFVLSEAAYKKNITEHKAISQVPYEAVFCIFPRKQMPDATEEDHTEESEQMTTMEEENAHTLASTFKMTFHHLQKILA